MSINLRGNIKHLLNNQRFVFSLAGLITILYTSRLGAEFVLPENPLAGMLLGLLTGSAVIWWLLRGRQTAPSLFLLLPSILFPFQSPELALLCGLLALISHLAHRHPLADHRVEAGVFFAGLLVYGLTLAPGVQPADGGEFQLIIAEWGVAHPPGYPLYTMLAGLFARILPINDIAWRVNLFSAVTGALTLAVAAWIIRRETGSGWAALIGAGILGSASAFWTTSTQASIRPLTALFMALMIAAALAYRRALSSNIQRGEKRALLLFGLAAGFGVTHHASLIFSGSILALAIFVLNPRIIRMPRQWGLALAGALAGALPWGYLLARGAAGARLAPPALTSWDGFWQHVLATGFAGDMFYYRTWPSILERLGLLAETLLVQWHWGVPLLIISAFTLLIWRCKWAAFALGGAFAIHAVVTATYRAPQTVEYMLPAYTCLAILAGLGIGQIRGNQRFSALRPAIIALVAAAILWSAWPTWVSLRAYQTIDQTAPQAREALHAAPADSTLLTNWHQTTPLWYIQSAETLRADVQVRYMAPQGSEPILETWTTAVREAATTENALLTCSYYPESFRHTDLTFSASGPCWQVTDATTPFSEVPPLATFDTIPLVEAQTASSAAAGEILNVKLAWLLRESAPYGSLTAFLHLVDETGLVAAQVDAPFLAGSPFPGLVRQRLQLWLPRTLQPGTYHLMAGLYRPGPEGPQPLTAATGATRSTIATVDVLPSSIPPVTAHSMHTPLSETLQLSGYDYDLSLPGRARLYLHWRLGAAESSTGWDITLSQAGSGLAQGRLAASAAAGFVSTAYDIPDTAAAQGISITVTHAGQILPVRGAWQLPVQETIYLPPVRTRTRYIPVGHAILTGYTLQPHPTSEEDMLLTITLNSTLPQIQDITLKAVSTAGQVEAPPLQGMLPSLKWGWNTQFTSTIALPSALTAPPPTPVTLTLYDAFISEAWPVFDSALSEGAATLNLYP